MHYKRKLNSKQLWNIHDAGWAPTRPLLKIWIISLKMSMWNRKNSVAIQSYSAKANKPEPDENKRVSEMFFTVILLASGERWKWCDDDISRSAHATFRSGDSNDFKPQRFISRRPFLLAFKLANWRGSSCLRCSLGFRAFS